MTSRPDSPLLVMSGAGCVQLLVVFQLRPYSGGQGEAGSVVLPPVTKLMLRAPAEMTVSRTATLLFLSSNVMYAAAQRRLLSALA